MLGLRKELELFANLRPCICFDELADASTLKQDIIAGLDILIVRELTGGIYFGEPKGIETLSDGQQKGYNTLVYTTSEIERIGKVAFDLAKKRNEAAKKARVCSIDKANVLVATELWRNTMNALHAKEYQDVELSHMYVDNAAMQLVRNPKQFDVVVTTNMFGDILSDIGAQLTGSLGMLPSASLGTSSYKNTKSESGDQSAPSVSEANSPCESQQTFTGQHNPTPKGEGIIMGVYEPVHGSAPDIAGLGLANPIATILSAAMLLRHSLSQPEAADAIENAVKQALADGYRTADIMQDGMKNVSTKEMGDVILGNIG